MRPFIVLFLILISIQLSLSTRGVSPQDAQHYKEGPFTCRDGSETIDFHRVNDDYCDCKDGSDEPGTSACSPLGSFYCKNKGHKNEILLSSRVNDGICDCCDGSDEYVSEQCANTCLERGAAARKVLQEKIEKHKEGSKARERHQTESVRKIQEKREELSSHQEKLKNLEESLKKEKEKKDSLKEDKKLLEKLIKKDADETDRKTKEILREIEEAKKSKELSSREEQQDNKEAEKSSLDESDADADVDLDTEEGSPSTFDDEDNSAVSDADDLDEEDDDKDEDEDEDEEDEHEVEVAPETPTAFKETPEVSDDDLETFRSRLQKEGVDPQKYLDDIKQVDDKWRDLDKEKRDLDRKIKDLSDALNVDFGRNNEYFHLFDNQYSYESNGYTYKLHPFSKVTQGHVNLGKWEEWIQTKEGLAMHYTNGEKCWGGPNRETTVRFYYYC
eukprot:TRINITY_DN2365_c0_g1_i1.p1 TRINITY_DN2365_c0_g1~~TRINITY_DN2365_c0_g1_i1.p1  ORF type:complete len:445 (-),score=120.89 TRINITY_DN2365_c0_g1_i1:210-1544(-)